MLECSEDVPFSPLRQSYTPLPMNQLNCDNIIAAHDDDDDDDNIITADIHPTARNYSNDSENGLHIIDIKLNEQMLDDANDEEHLIDDNINMSIGKEDVVLFTVNTTHDGKLQKNYKLFKIIFVF